MEKASEWPGVNSVRSILDDEPLVGYWFNREREWKARRRGEIVDTYDYATRYEIELARPSCLADLTPEEYQKLIRALAREVEEKAAAKRGDGSVLGAAAILAQNPLEPLPTPLKKSPAPRLFFASSPEENAILRQAYDEFVQEYRLATSLLHLQATIDGGLGLVKEFPQGCYPPSLPFIGALPLPCPPTPPTRQLECLADGEYRRGPIPVIRISGRGHEGVAQGGTASPTSGSSHGSRARRMQQLARDPPS